MPPGLAVAILVAAKQTRSEPMNDEQRALPIPSKVLFELWYATVFHLFERNQIDGNAVANLLERRRLD